MGHVAKGNEHMATEDVRAKVAAVAEKFAQMRALRDEIMQMCRDDDLWHLDLDYCFELESDPVERHERWLASSHNC